MKPPAFSYHDPDTIDDAVGLLASLENARLLAGGQSLMPMLNMRYVLPDHIIDLRRVPGLDGIREVDGQIRFGTMTRQRDLEFSELVQARLPLMHQAILQVGHRQTRNRGTIGGSLCHLDPAAELPTICVALEAELVARGPEGERIIPAAEWGLSYMTPSLAPDEMLTEIRITPWPAGHRACFMEFARRHGDFAIASAAVLLLAEAGEIRQARVVLGGIGPAPLRMEEAEAMLIGQAGTPDLFAQVGELCAAQEAMGDALVPADYRAHIAGVMAKRALTAAWAGGAA
jgi:aerobic carbon-monoxide dehydrogenase medium subunit